MLRSARLAVIGVTLAAACGSKKDEPRPAPAVARHDAGPAVPTLTIAPGAPAVGLVQHTDDEVIQILSVLQAGAAAPEALRLERHVTKHVEVLAVRDGLRTSVRVHYEVGRDAQTAGGETSEQIMPVVGKRYVVAREADGAMTVTAADGAAISDEERALVEEDFSGELGRLPGMAGIIIGRAWPQGAAVALGPDEIAQVAADMGAGDEVRALTVTWTGSDAGVASFDFAIDVIRAGGVKMPMKAIVKIDVAHARPVEVLGTASIEGASADGKVSGTMTIHTQNRYE